MKLKAIVLTSFLACGLCACATSGSSHRTTVVRERGDKAVVHERGDGRTTVVRDRGGVDVVVRPPAPKVVVVPSARAGYVWAPGYWRWNGRDHIWVDGTWMRERQGERWVPAHWEERGDRWHFEEGHWER